MRSSNFYGNDQYYNQNRADQGEMRVIGIGNIQTEPDIAIVNLGVITEAKNLETAQRENIIISNRVIDKLEEIGVLRKDIQTSIYNIEPQYDYIEGKQIFRNYKVTNIFTVTIRDIENVGEIIDAAVSTGVNNVGNINFTISDYDYYYKRTLQSAVINAIEKAVTIGETLRIPVNTVPVSIKEQPPIQEFESRAIMKTYTASTPVMPGEIEITATVEASFQY
ncbi:MAG: SIMPL domain-containing protein [Clostridium argentinense]|nr:SIMPL domain-containing protein [Clostridium argentinense]